MGEITLLRDTMPDLLPMQDRSPGVHVSSVIALLCRRMGLFPKDGDSKLTTVWAQLGCALEHAVIERFERHYPGRYIQPGELELDGVYGTPDLLDLDDWAVDEIKLAWMSAKHEPESEKMWRYWTQVKSYCRMAGTDVGRLHVCFVNGHYRGAGPVWRSWEQRFDEQELAENWAMIRTHAELIREGVTE